MPIRHTDESKAYRTWPKMTNLSLPRRNLQGGATAEFGKLARQFIQGDGMAVERTTKELRPLCYAHHVEMKPVQLERSTNSFTTYSLAYACPLSGCAIGYAGENGYFAEESNRQSKQTEVLRVGCPQDGLPMYLAAIHPEHTTLRLWRCAKTDCQGHRTIEEFIFEPNDPFLERYFRTN
jgi:hypothetical protein